MLLSSHVFSSRVKVESRKFEFERVRVLTFEKFRVRVRHARVRVNNRVITFYSEFAKIFCQSWKLPQIISKKHNFAINYRGQWKNLEITLKSHCSSQKKPVIFAENCTRVESSLCFTSSSFLEFAPEMLRASSNEFRDFWVLQSTSQARVRVVTR